MGAVTKRHDHVGAAGDVVAVGVALDVMFPSSGNTVSNADDAKVLNAEENNIIRQQNITSCIARGFGPGSLAC